LVASLLQYLVNLSTDLFNYQRRIEDLTHLGAIKATPYYRDDKYLYLIYPSDHGSRQREYIGSDPDQIAEALAKLDRWGELQQAKAHLSTIELNIYSLHSRVRDLLRDVRDK
jgi:hypothetical protein